MSSSPGTPPPPAAGGAGVGAGVKSPVSTGTSDRGVNPPPPPMASSRPPRNCTASAMMSMAWRFCPSCVSHSRHSSRPALAAAQPAVDGDGAALAEEACAVLALCAPDGHVEVVRLVLPLAARVVLAARVARDAERADRHAARE